MTSDAGGGNALSPASERPRSFFARNSTSNDAASDREVEEKPTRWSMGVLNDPETHEVPGSVLLLTGHRNEPLGLRNAPARTSTSTLPPQSPVASRRQSHQQKAAEGKKLTKDGKIILEPQPDDSHNDPLNWPGWKRDAALLSLGLYCMVGGGMTPILAAGFNNVAHTFDVTVPKVALTTGLYMMGMGVGSVFASPTAILYGKRPVYLGGAILFICTSVWCAASPSYYSLLVARIFQGMSISPVECLPSATIAEIFFLHERAYRIGIYTLLLLGGKNLVPLVSAAIIQRLDWRWVFWICAMVGGFCLVLLFLFVPETFWDRTPRPKSRNSSKKASRRTSRFSLFTRKSSHPHPVPDHDIEKHPDSNDDDDEEKTSPTPLSAESKMNSSAQRSTHNLHVGFAADGSNAMEGSSDSRNRENCDGGLTSLVQSPTFIPLEQGPAQSGTSGLQPNSDTAPPHPATHSLQDTVIPAGGVPPTPHLPTLNSPSYMLAERTPSADYFAMGPSNLNMAPSNPNVVTPSRPIPDTDGSKDSPIHQIPTHQHYTAILKAAPRQKIIQQLKPYNGRLHYDKWIRVAIRPFILFAYPAVLWSSIVYACSVGWLIVLSESVSIVYRSRDTYGFSALSTGLIYLSPFIGGIVGTAVAGKVSDLIVRAMSKRNGGLYEPEFRLVMAIPISISTVIGLMGFGWSAHVHDAWIVPTIFFGVISFGCSLGSTTAITFCVDSYRQYAGEALVTLNFSKNIFHGMVFSLFFASWLEREGSKSVFIWLGVIQLILMAFSIPMYIFGKRARMWTARKNLMEKF